MIEADDILVRPHWARLKHCAVRGQWTLLVPERVLFPCATTVEVLERLATPTRFGDVVAELAGEYDAPETTIASDLALLLGQLVEDGYVKRA